MNRSALAFVFGLLVAPVAFAQQSPASAPANPADAPASRQDIERYLDAMHTRDLMHSMMNAMTAQMHKMVHDMVAKQPNLPSDFESRMDKTTDDMLRNFPIDELIDAMIPVYQKHLSKGDVDALVAFYTTPTGQKILKEMPAMTAEAMQAASGITQKTMAKMLDRVQDEIAQMLKDNPPASKPQTSNN